MTRRLFPLTAAHHHTAAAGVPRGPRGDDGTFLGWSTELRVSGECLSLRALQKRNWKWPRPSYYHEETSYPPDIGAPGIGVSGGVLVGDPKRDSVGSQPWESSCLVFFVSFCALEEITSEPTF